jgi:hypothetical protein
MGPDHRAEVLGQRGAAVLIFMPVRHMLENQHLA